MIHLSTLCPQCSGPHPEIVQVEGPFTFSGPLPASTPCEECRGWNRDPEACARAGGLAWECLGCGRIGGLGPAVALTQELRQAAGTEEPLKAELDSCPWCESPSGA